MVGLLPLIWLQRVSCRREGFVAVVVHLIVGLVHLTLEIWRSTSYTQHGHVCTTLFAVILPLCVLLFL
jgi:hypothetical protein